MSASAKAPVRPARSLRQRLLAAAALWITLALGAVGLLLVLLFRQHVEQELALRAQGQLDVLIAGVSVAPAANDSEGPPLLTVLQNPPEPAFQQPYGGWYWLVEDTPGQWRRSRSWWDTAPAQVFDAAREAPAGRLLRLEGPGPAGQSLVLWARRIELAGLDQPRTVAVAADATRLDGLTRDFARTVVLALGALALTLWIAAWLQVRQGLAPMARLQSALRGLRAGRLERIAGPYPGEVQPLVDDLNAVLDDNATLVERAREETGNLAHALKTPLAVLGNSAASWPGEDGVLVRDQLARMQAQLDWHLARARSMAHLAAARHRGQARSPLQPTVQGLVRALERLYDSRPLHWEADLPAPPLTLAVDTESLQEMLGNLLDNASQWARHRIWVHVLPAGTGTRPLLGVAIEDDGPGIPAAQRAQALQRGLRLDERHPGSGLGLAITEELARLHGGQLELGDAELGGLRATLWLPLATDEMLFNQ